MPEQEQAVQLKKTRALATGLLVAMAALFLVARSLQLRFPLLSFAAAFAEAAMVGGLADWFAVTALFRSPLGLPIPHTAIIPGLAIVLTVLGLNLMGDGLRDIFDPRLRRNRQ